MRKEKMNPLQFIYKRDHSGQAVPLSSLGKNDTGSSMETATHHSLFPHSSMTIYLNQMFCLKSFVSNISSVPMKKGRLMQYIALEIWQALVYDTITAECCCAYFFPGFIQIVATLLPLEEAGCAVIGLNVLCSTVKASPSSIM